MGLVHCNFVVARKRFAKGDIRSVTVPTRYKFPSKPRIASYGHPDGGIGSGTKKHTHRIGASSRIFTAMRGVGTEQRALAVHFYS